MLQRPDPPAFLRRTPRRRTVGHLPIALASVALVVLLLVAATTLVGGRRAPLAADAFERIVSAGWGRADAGGAYTYAGTRADFAVAGGMGTMTLPAGGANRGAYLPEVSAANVEVRLRVSVDALPVDAPAWIYTVLRYHASGAEYRIQLRITPAGRVYVAPSRVSDGAETLIIRESEVAMRPLVAGQWLWIRAGLAGSAPTAIRAKVWPQGAAEPSIWRFIERDETPALQLPGAVGVRAYLGTAAEGGVTVAVDDVTVRVP
jgi:hypothetical protein